MKISYKTKSVIINRILLIIANFLLIATLCYVVFINSLSVKPLSDFYVDEIEFNSIKSSRYNSVYPLVKEISFNNFQLFEDEMSGNWFYSIVEDDKDAYNPLVKISSYHGKIKYAALKYDFSEYSISHNIPIKFIAYNNTSYYTFDVICTTLPIVNLTKEDINIFDNRAGVKKRFFRSTSNYKIKGNASRWFSKKTFKLRLHIFSPGNNPRKISKSILGMPSGSNWELYAGYNDPLRIRNVFSAKLWSDCCSHNNVFDINNSFEYKYIELFLNNKYHGLYAIGYPLNRYLADIKNNEYLLKKETWYYYILKAGPKNENFVLGSNPIIKDFYETIKGKNKKDNKEIYNAVDIGNSIDMWLFVNFIQGEDQTKDYLLNNHYLIIKKYMNRYKMIYTPWDMDQTWGFGFNSIMKNTTDENAYKYSDNIIMKSSAVYTLLQNKDPKIKNLIKSRYSYLRKTSWSYEHITNMLDNYENEIYNSGAYQRDIIRWKNSNQLTDPNVKLSEFKKYIKKRINVMDAYVDSITSEKKD